MKIVLTCEHAGNEVPEKFQHLFTSAAQILNSHRAYDPGAFDLFNDLKKPGDFCHFQIISRLLVETNRSLGHPQLFSEFTVNLAEEEKQHLLQEYYHPYRKKVEEKIAETIARGEKVLHISVHTFTPQLNERVRNADVGFLYDPRRTEEKEFCKNWKKALNKENENLKLRFNYPYLGRSDGFTTYLRKKFPGNYIGVELEVNQKHVVENRMNFGMKKEIEESLAAALA